MTKRGVRPWAGPDLFDGAPPDAAPSAPAPAAPPPPSPSAPPRRYTDRECRRLEKVLDLFKDWLFAAQLKVLESADPVALAQRFRPMQEWDIAQMIAGQISHYDRKDEIWRKWQRIR